MGLPESVGQYNDDQAQPGERTEGVDVPAGLCGKFETYGDPCADHPGCWSASPGGMTLKTGSWRSEGLPTGGEPENSRHPPVNGLPTPEMRAPIRSAQWNAVRYLAFWRSWMPRMNLGRPLVARDPRFHRAQAADVSPLPVSNGSVFFEGSIRNDVFTGSLLR